MAILYGVGMGAGDPELVTLKAIRIIKECQVLAIPAVNYEESLTYKIALQVVPEIKDKEIINLDMPMIKDAEMLKAIHYQGAERIMKKLSAGSNVAFLTIGDSAIYSTYTYIQDIVVENGYETQIVSGIPSFVSAASLINNCLALKDEMIHIIPSTYGVEEAIQLTGTKVFMKAGKKLKVIKDSLRGKDVKVFFLENIGLSDEKIIEGTRNIPDEAGYFSIVIVFG